MHNPDGQLRVVVTKDLPGERWKQILASAGCRVEVCTAPATILDNATIKQLIGSKCDGVIGQLTEVGRQRFSQTKLQLHCFSSAAWPRLPPWREGECERGFCLPSVFLPPPLSFLSSCVKPV